MGDTTDISWADKTFNPWIGCTNVSPACDHCYAESLAKRWAWAEWGPGKPRRRTSEANWRKPLVWERQAIKEGTRPRVFCASLADWADAEVSDEWRADLFAVIRATPHLEWLLLSKRHALIMRLLDKHAQGLKNIRIGVTVENNEMADIRLQRLFDVKLSGFPTFVSYEPALGPVDWPKWMEHRRYGCIDWLIAGGESGAGWRGPNPQWFYDARDACQQFEVPFHFKQWGACQEGHVLAGREWLEFPT